MPFIKKIPLTIAGNVAPDDAYFWYEGNIPDSKCLKWDETQQLIIVDSDQEKAVLDQMVHLPKLDIRRAMRDLGLETQLNTLLSYSEVFRNDWNDSELINTDDPIFIQALAMSEIKIDDIKRKIIAMQS